MRVRVTRNFGPLGRGDFFTTADFAQVGRLVRERLIRRTLAGLDENDRQFRRYSPSYAAKKAASLGAGSTPNLQVSGAMLQAITVHPYPTKVILKFSN